MSIWEQVVKIFESKKYKEEQEMELFECNINVNMQDEIDNNLIRIIDFDDP